MDLRDKSYSPTSEDLLLSIEREKKELLKLKQDLDSYKTRNRRLRNRQQRIIDGHEWDDALSNLKKVSEISPAPSSEVTGRLLFKCSRDNMSEIPTGLALLSTTLNDDEPSPRLQYITLPEANKRRPQATDTNFQYRNSIAVDHSRADQIEMNTPRELALSEPCSPQLGSNIGSIDEMLYEDLSEADDFMSLKSKLEGIEEQEEEDNEEDDHYGVPTRPITRLDFTISPKVFSSTSTLNANMLMDSRDTIEDYGEGSFASVLDSSFESHDGMFNQSTDSTSFFSQVSDRHNPFKAANKYSFALASEPESEQEDESENENRSEDEIEAEIEEEVEETYFAESEEEGEETYLAEIEEVEDYLAEIEEEIKEESETEIEEEAEQEYLAEFEEFEEECLTEIEEKVEEESEAEIEEEFEAGLEEEIDDEPEDVEDEGGYDEGFDGILPHMFMSENSYREPEPEPEPKPTKFKLTICTSDAQPSPIMVMEEDSKHSSFRLSMAKSESTPCLIRPPSEKSAPLSPMNNYQPSPILQPTTPAYTSPMDAMLINAFSQPAIIPPVEAPAVKLQESLIEDGDMTVTPRRIKNRISYLVPKADKSSLLSDMLNIFDMTSSALDSDPATLKVLSRAQQRQQKVQQPLRTSISDPSLQKANADPIPQNPTRLKLELTPTLDLHLAATTNTISNPKSQRRPFYFTATSSLRSKLFSSTSNLSLVTKFDRNRTEPRAPLLQRLREFVKPSSREWHLYQFDDTKTNTLIASGDEISSRLLNPRNAYVLECESALFLWFGRQANDAKQRDASRFAGTLMKSLRLRFKLSSSHTIRVEFEGSESNNFTAKFPDWGEAGELEENLAEIAIQHNLPGRGRLEDVYLRQPTEPLSDLDDCQSLSLKVWLMRGSQDHLELGASEHGIFYSSESYVMLYHYRDSNHMDKHVVFYWIGRNSKRAKEPILPPSKVALDNHNEALMVQVLQGRESNVFMSLFNGLVIVRWGARRPFPTDKALFHVRGTSQSNVKAEQTTCSPKYLCSGHSFVLMSKGRFYVWHGIGSFLFERLMAVQAAKRLGGPDARVVEVREKLEPRKFWTRFGGERSDYADALQWARKPFLQSQYNVRMFQLSPDPVLGIAVDEVRPFHQGDLDLGRAFLLDTYFDLFLWCRYEGNRSGSTEPTNATLLACLNLCMEYTNLIETRESRPFKLKPIMVLPGHEPLEFIAQFPGWDLQQAPITSRPGGTPSRFKPSTLKRKASTRALPVEYLLSKFLPQPQPPTTIQTHTSHASTLNLSSTKQNPSFSFGQSLRETSSHFATSVSFA
ncbi:hypothetical protein DSO57_1013596 [Entomophthora muscae]|uniref:Uncharacterized protein n=1 Tax=Entomophthora muscae TaxID=34485 RepID=A0ACC2RX01_9FUNG|nr:hypothetical protein DSO57_1013596 [Entomophthora muscae]